MDGGFGAALAGARLGLSVVLVERAEKLGGTSTHGGVNCWEMGAGGTGIPFDLYRRLRRVPHAVGVYSFGRHFLWQSPDTKPYRFPGGEQVIDPNRRYIDTLRRHGSKGMAVDEAFCREVWHGLPFEPEAMDRVMREMLAETGNCAVLLKTAFRGVSREGGRVKSVAFASGQELTAGVLVDSTGDAVLCAAAGCETMMGQESRDRFGEPGAPETPTDHLNGVTLIYRITPTATPGVEPLPEGIPAKCWWSKGFPGVCMNTYPNGDRNLNMLPTMEGRQFRELGYGPAYEECRRRVYAHWHHFQTTYEEFRRFRLLWIAPTLGVRESRRVVGEHVLTQNDLLAGLSGQKHDDIICIADHAMDTHGHSTGRAGCGELNEPYGVPFRCLVPKGWKNLLVACRASSFSSIAASSCRLSRTMMQLGQAAGTAAALAKRLAVAVCDVPPTAFRQSLQEQHVQLDWPPPPDLREHLANDAAAV
jgi:hypothetical protein